MTDRYADNEAARLEDGVLADDLDTIPGGLYDDEQRTLGDTLDDAAEAFSEHWERVRYTLGPF